MSKIVAAIAIALLMGCATPTTAEVITGFTVNNAPACVVDDLSTENMNLISEWARVNRLRVEDPDGMSAEDYALGQSIYQSGNCGLLKPGTPVTIVLSDGTIYLLQFPDGALMGVVDSGFSETMPEDLGSLRTIAPTDGITGKEFRIDED